MVMLEVSTPGTTAVRNQSSTPPRDQAGRVEDHDLVAFGTHQTIAAEFPQHPNNHLPHRPHGIGKLPLTDLDDDRGSRLTPWSTLNGKVEQMSRHALAHRCKGVSRDLIYKAHHPLTELAKEGSSDQCVTCNCPASNSRRHPQKLGIHDRLCARRHCEVDCEQRCGTQERSGPAVANSHRATVRSSHKGPHNSRDHQLKVRAGLTFAMRNRASRNPRPNRTRHKLAQNLRWQLTQMRHRQRGTYRSIHGRTLQRW
jgi:hypothetical protein